MDGGLKLKITIRYFDGCPNWRTAEHRLRQALDEVGPEADIAHEVVSAPEDAERLRFPGSPTILVDGVDPFPAETDSYGLTCRVYRTEAGQEGSPSTQQIREALGHDG
jgi:hypothetical protein